MRVERMEIYTTASSALLLLQGSFQLAKPLFSGVALAINNPHGEAVKLGGLALCGHLHTLRSMENLLYVVPHAARMSVAFPCRVT